MYSSFRIKKSDCMSCNNVVLKTLGTLRGVFSADLDRVNSYVLVNHTDEVSRNEIKLKLIELGWTVIEGDIEETESNYTPPSEWGCAL
jgi:copper chaperone CopZ